jgi:hypothetical protein
LRNYINYGFFQPSTIVSQDLFDILAGRIYESKGFPQMKDSLAVRIDSIHSPKEKMHLENEIAYAAIKKYPLTAIKIMGLENTINAMFDNMYLQVIVCFGYKWKSSSITYHHKDRAITYPYKSLRIITYFYYALMLVYLVIYLLFLLYLRSTFISKDFTTLLFLSVFFLFLLFPAFIIGDGGARFRITVEWMITMFAFYELEHLILLFRYKKE